jgi:hypothetical protein
MEVRTIREDEFDAFELALSNAFGDVEAAEHEVASDRLSIEFDRTFAAFDDGRIAAVQRPTRSRPSPPAVGRSGPPA